MASLDATEADVDEINDDEDAEINALIAEAAALEAEALALEDEANALEQSAKSLDSMFFLGDAESVAAEKEEMAAASAQLLWKVWQRNRKGNLQQMNDVAYLSNSNHPGAFYYGFYLLIFYWVSLCHYIMCKIL